MHIRQVLALGVALVIGALATPSLLAQNNQNDRREQERRSQQDQRDTEALVKLVDGVSTGALPAPSDVRIAWDSSYFVKSSDGATYVPFTLTIDKSSLAGQAAVYVRVVSKQAAAPPPANANTRDNNRNRQNERVTYPWDDVYFLDVPADGKVSRAVGLKPGEYEVFIVAKERLPQQNQRNAPPPKAGLLRRDLSVPDFNKTELQTSSVIMAAVLEVLNAPLAPAQQQENPFTFGAMRVVPSPDSKFSKAGELQVLFWVYGTGANAGKPDVQIDFNFHQKTADGEKYFNKTPPQMLNAETLPPQFDLAAGHQLPGTLVVPLKSFPEGDYRLEIKVTDKISGSSLSQNASFSVIPG